MLAEYPAARNRERSPDAVARRAAWSRRSRRCRAQPRRVLRAILTPLASELDADPVSIYLRDDTGALVLQGQSETDLRADRPDQ